MFKSARGEQIKEYTQSYYIKLPKENVLDKKINGQNIKNQYKLVAIGKDLMLNCKRTELYQGNGICNHQILNQD